MMGIWIPCMDLDGGLGKLRALGGAFWLGVENHGRFDTMGCIVWVQTHRGPEEHIAWRCIWISSCWILFHTILSVHLALVPT